MTNSTRLLAAALLALTACSSKHNDAKTAPAPAPAPAPASAPAPAPAPLTPGPGGIALRTSGAATIAIDTVGGYQIEFPSAPDVEERPLATARGTRPGVAITHGDGASAMVVMITRVHPDEADPKSGTAAAIAGLRKTMELTTDEPITLAGLPGRRYEGKKTVEDTTLVVRGILLVDQTHATLYQIMTTQLESEAPDPALAHFAESFAVASKS